MEEPMGETPAPESPAPVKRRRGATGEEPVAFRAVRQSRVRINKFDLASVLKLSLCFYVASVVVIVAAGIALWVIADLIGVIGDVESFLGKLLGSKNYRLEPILALEGSVLIGLVIAALGTVVTVVGFALYNLFAEVLGGVEATLVESPPKF